MSTPSGTLATRSQMLPPAYLLLALVAMAGLHLAFPWHQLVVFPWRLIGVVPLVLGLILNAAADRLFKQQRTPVKPFERPAALVTTGVYRVTRNPMYMGFVLILLGVAILMGSADPFFIVPLFVILIDVAFIRTEERMMDAAFGREWLAYRAKVRRWI